MSHRHESILALGNENMPVQASLRLLALGSRQPNHTYLAVQVLVTIDDYPRYMSGSAWACSFELVYMK